MSFILDALRKLEEKRAPETTRELLAAGVPAPQGRIRGKPLWPYYVTAALAATLLAAAGWFALKEHGAGGDGKIPPAISSGKAGEGSLTVQPPPPAAAGGAPVMAGKVPAQPDDPLPVPAASGPVPGSPSPEGVPVVGKEVPDSTASPGAVGSAPLSGQGGEGPVEPEMTASPDPGEPATPMESSTEAPLLPLHELPEKIQDSLKDLRIEGHVYSDDPGFRLLSIDGSLRREGDTVRPGLLIETISSEGAVFTYRGYRFSMKGY